MVNQTIRIDYARSTLPESCIFAGGRDDREVPILFSVFLIRTEDKNILVDAGCETMPGFIMEDFITPMAALEKQGIAVTDITDVIITHAHHDHIECVKYFPRARVHIQQDASVKGLKYLSENENICTFSEEKLVADGVKVVRIGGHAVGSCVVECEKDDAVYVFCGDECYTRYNLINKVQTAASCCPEKSQAFIEKYTKAPYVCLLCHDL